MRNYLFCADFSEWNKIASELDLYLANPTRKLFNSHPGLPVQNVMNSLKWACSRPIRPFLFPFTFGNIDFPKSASSCCPEMCSSYLIWACSAQPCDVTISSEKGHKKDFPSQVYKHYSGHLCNSIFDLAVVSLWATWRKIRKTFKAIHWYLTRPNVQLPSLLHLEHFKYYTLYGTLHQEWKWLRNAIVFCLFRVTLNSWMWFRSVC